MVAFPETLFSAVGINSKTVVFFTIVASSFLQETNTLEERNTQKTAGKSNLLGNFLTIDVCLFGEFL